VLCAGGRCGAPAGQRRQDRAVRGDGGFLFHIQEFETLKRQRYRILMGVMNDGGCGSEFLKLRAVGVDDRWALFGRPAFENIARGFGLCGNEIRDVSVIPKLFADFTARGSAKSGTSRSPTRSRRR
jgi:thiamine pyrophosphate-dependent acetolactate synthase large subunit-like protein